MTKRKFDQTASFFSAPLSDSSPGKKDNVSFSFLSSITIITIVTVIIISIIMMMIMMIITRGSDLLGDHGQVLLPLSQRLGVWRPPAECVEHVEEGDGDVDEDDQRVERVRDQLVGTFFIRGWGAKAGCLLSVLIIVKNHLKLGWKLGSSL